MLFTTVTNQILGLVPAATFSSAIFLRVWLHMNRQMSCFDRPYCHVSSPNIQPAPGKAYPANFWLSSLSFSPTPFGLMCVCERDSPEMERISLSQCKKQFLPYSTCTSSDMIRVSPHLFTTAGAFLHPWGLFCTFCSTQLNNKVTTHISQSLLCGGV